MTDIGEIETAKTEIWEIETAKTDIGDIETAKTEILEIQTAQTEIGEIQTTQTEIGESKNEDAYFREVVQRTNTAKKIFFINCPLGWFTCTKIIKYDERF